MNLNINKNPVSHVDNTNQTFDIKCHRVLQNLEINVEKAFKRSVQKTSQMLILMSQVQTPQIFFVQCNTILTEQSLKLIQGQKSKLTSVPNFQKKHSSFQMHAPFNHAQLSCELLQRFQKVKNNNTHSCFQAYGNLLRQGPLLNHLQNLPETARLLLDASPENCQENLYQRILDSTPENNKDSEHSLVIFLILTSYFFSSLASIYQELEQHLMTLFQEHCLSPAQKLRFNNEDVLYDKALTATTEKKAIKTTLKTTPLRIEPEMSLPPQENHEQPPMFQLVPVQHDRSTAIERQILERASHEQAARAQLKQMPLGTLIQWSGSHFDRTSKILKLVNHDHAHNLIVFIDERSGEFIRFKITMLVQFILHGDMVKIPSQPRSYGQKHWSRIFKSFISSYRSKNTSARA